MTSVLLIVYDTISSIFIDKYDDFKYHIITFRPNIGRPVLSQKGKNFGAGKFCLFASVVSAARQPAVCEIILAYRRRDADEPGAVLHTFTLRRVWRGRTRPQAGCGRPAAVPSLVESSFSGFYFKGSFEIGSNFV